METAYKVFYNFYLLYAYLKIKVDIWILEVITVLYKRCILQNTNHLIVNSLFIFQSLQMYDVSKLWNIKKKLIVICVPTKFNIRPHKVNYLFLVHTSFGN